MLQDRFRNVRFHKDRSSGSLGAGRATAGFLHNPQQLDLSRDELNFHTVLARADYCQTVTAFRTDLGTLLHNIVDIFHRQITELFPQRTLPFSRFSR